MDELILRQDYSGQIRNRLLRFLHAQAYGRTKLPIYAGLEDRDELLAAIGQHAGLAEEPENREREAGNREPGTEGVTL